jgi:hypothetical protein
LPRPRMSLLPPRRRPAHSGRMFWLTWKALSGSYFALTAASRW